MSNILAFGTYNTRKHPRVGILIEGLRCNGCQVTEINRPLTLSTADRVAMLQQPWKVFGLIKTLAVLWYQLSREAKAWMRANNRPDAILVGYMGHFDVLLAHHLFRGIPIVLDHLIFAGDTAKDRGAKGFKVKLLNRLDRLALDAATLVLTDTEEHQSMLKDTDRSLVVPVGAQQQWYDAGKHSTHTSGDIIFFGLYTPLQGVPVIADALLILNAEGIHPHVTLIGKGQDYEQVWNKLHKLPEVHFIDWVDPEQLPEAVASNSIALGIFSTTAKGMRVIPNKVYESMAAGCAVVTSDTPPQNRLVGAGTILVPPGDPQKLAAALRVLLSDASARDHAMRAARATGAKYSARRITAQLSKTIENL
ncbi:glycosyltransferase [Bifidobacterium crudilactis]|uniref:glycosyltransferase n=1 Tax=Bifidobacterium crudilactis TaxID=327277 RepID=UPI002F357AF2